MHHLECQCLCVCVSGCVCWSVCAWHIWKLLLEHMKNCAHNSKFCLKIFAINNFAKSTNSTGSRVSQLFAKGLLQHHQHQQHRYQYYHHHHYPRHRQQQQLFRAYFTYFAGHIISLGFKFQVFLAAHSFVWRDVQRGGYLTCCCCCCKWRSWVRGGMLTGCRQQTACDRKDKVVRQQWKYATRGGLNSLLKYYFQI